MGFSMISLFLVLNILFQVHLRADASSSPEVGKHAVPAPNIALNGISTQSSTQAYYGRPRNANDGSIANNYLRSQCSYTEKELDPWWMVDLRKSYKIFAVAITNRVLECCKERLYGAEIRIGNDPTQGGRLNPRCGVISTIESGETISFSCHGMIGKYVTVTIPGREEHLVLCEVQVFGVLATPSDVQPSEEELKTTLNGAPNVAVHGISSQSSLYNMYGVSKNAIDGSLSSNYLFIECTGTAEQDNPWWMIDLKVKHKIFTVAVTNRGDCCADKINGAQIRIGNSAENGGADNTICGVIEKMDHGQTLAFECAGMEGQYVTVNLPASNQSLFICEVQVFGVPTGQVTEEQLPSTENTGIDFSWLDFFGRLDDYFDYSSKEDIDIPDEQEEEEQGINLAFRGVSSQSSTYDKFGAAANAIDGSSGNKYMSGHCSHTDLDIEPWWRVDLTNTYNITKVKIMNRGDCCNERIKGAEIRIGLSQEKGGTRNPRCATIESLGLGNEIEFICGMVGRYVTVTIPDKAAYLTLCEVKIYGDEISENYTIPHFPYDSEEHHEATELRNILKHSNAAPNVALQGVTYQSSIDGECDSRRAADGSLKNLLPDDQCARTKEEMDPWWTVDLKSDHKVFSIAVTSRGDCCEHDLDGAEIHVGNSATGWKKNPICGTVSSIGPGETFSFNCDGMEGRFVTIVIPQKAKSLTICEVQVFGVPVDAISAEWTGNLELQKEHHGAKNVAPAGIPSQSSYFSRKSEVMTAIDGSLSSNYMAGECTHTLKQFNPWWRLDLKSKMRVHSVAITNRGDCCRERINGAEVRIGDSEADGGIKNPRCGVVYKMNYGETLSFNCKGMEGQYVTITIPDNREFLTLCEVQVFADPTEAAEEKSSEPVEISESSLKLNITNDLSGNYFYFPEENDNSYVYLSPKISMDLKALTLCMKISPNIDDNRETILFSYRTTYYDELNLWIESSGNIGLYMSGEGIMFSPLNHKKEWAHLCLTWESKYGRCELWLNGRRKGPKIYRRSHSIRPGGIVLLGQDQDSLGGNFDAAQSYVGKIKDLNMWNKVLSLRSLRSVFKNKQVQAGTVFDWRSLNYMIKGNVTVV